MRLIFAASTAVAALTMAAPALAQSALWSGNGELTDGDRQAEDEHRFDDHTIQLEAGRRYRISVDSEAFDPVAQLRRAGSDDVVAENDDGGESLNSRIDYTPGESGDYVLRVRGYSADGRGAYAARLEERAPPPPAITTPGRAVSTSGNWMLWEGSLESNESGERAHHDYLIRFEAGRPRYISLQGQGFDTLLQLIRPDSRDSDPPEVLEEDDDGGVELDSFLVYQAPESGDVIVRVTSFSGGGGAYRLWVSE